MLHSTKPHVEAIPAILAALAPPNSATPPRQPAVAAAVAAVAAAITSAAAQAAAARAAAQAAAVVVSPVIPVPQLLKAVFYSVVGLPTQQ